VNKVKYRNRTTYIFSINFNNSGSISTNFCGKNRHVLSTVLLLTLNPDLLSYLKICQGSSIIETRCMLLNTRVIACH